MDFDITLQKNNKTLRRASVKVDAGDLLVAAIDGVKEKLDISRPMILDKHVRDFRQFGIVVFQKTDFIEPVSFDRMVVEALNGPSDAGELSD